MADLKISLQSRRSSMDRIRVSEALDTGSIPVGRANEQCQAAAKQQ